MKKINWYWMFKNVILGPFLRIWNRPYTKGIERIPATGGALLTSNHQAVGDSFYLPLVCPRQITFIAKDEYFSTPGLWGAYQRWFFSAVGQVPVDRSSAQSGRDAIATACRILEEGELFGIYPEGTRSPDGRIYKGKTGAARIALTTGVPIIPIGMIGTRKANPIHSKWLRPTRVGVLVGEPFDPREFVKSKGLDPSPDNYEATRALTDEIIRRLVELTGDEYVDCYAADVKKSLAAGNGFPEGAAPKS